MQSAGAECEIEPFIVNCEPWTPAELLVGEIDLDWVDRQEVRIDRLVGTISFSEQAAANGQEPAPTIVRFGILETEDTDRLYQTIDLFDNESLEQFEWMWLHQFSFNHNSYLFNATNPGTYIRSSSADIPLDVRTRRKLGHKDSIVLYTQKRRVSAAPLGATDTSICRYVHQLRAIART